MNAERRQKTMRDDIPSSLIFDYTVLEYVSAGASILDVGCGMGKLCSNLSDRGYQCTGIDCSIDAIEAARLITKCSFVNGDAAKLPFPNNNFDLVICQAVFTNWTEEAYRQAVIREIQRVLKPLGLLYLADFAQTWHNEEYRQRYLRFYNETGEYGLFSRERSDGTGVDWYKHFSPKEITDLYMDAGFTTEKYTELPVRTRTGRIATGYVILCRNKQNK